jgi:uncharacterized protein YdaU (DUF1376 family)
MKETFYFSHDYNARSDVKIKRLIAKHGLLGYGIYWAIIEDLYQNANALPLDCESIAFDLRTNENIIESIIKDFGLFIVEGSEFGSLSVQRRLDERSERSKKAKESAHKRWNKDANAMRTHSDSNAIKERKGKESKGEESKEGKENNIRERKLKFASTLKPFVDIYGRDTINDFYEYWTENNKSNTKFKQELEKTWSLERRIKTWVANENKFGAKKSNEQKYNCKFINPHTGLFEKVCTEAEIEKLTSTGYHKLFKKEAI